jgi:hypothetical protein
MFSWNSWVCGGNLEEYEALNRMLMALIGMYSVFMDDENGTIRFGLMGMQLILGRSRRHGRTVLGWDSDGRS